MSDFSELIEVIEQAIKTNNNEEITGAILQGVLKDIVEALGDEAINALETALQNEINTRTLADIALGGRIDDEATARSNADTALSNRLGSTITAENTAADQIGAEAEAREAADTALQGLIDGITDNIENGYVYAGIATPSTTPVTGKVFYLALQGGQYTHFGNTAVMQGINIFKYNGSSWLHDAYIGISDKPIPSDTGLVKAGGTFDFVMDNGSAFDISKHFASGSTLATYADLDAALTALDGLDEEYKRAGMSIKYVQSSDNKYVQYLFKLSTFNIYQFANVDNWEKTNLWNEVDKLCNASIIINTTYTYNKYVDSGGFIANTSFEGFAISEFISIIGCSRIRTNVNLLGGIYIGFYKTISASASTIIGAAQQIVKGYFDIEVPQDAKYMVVSNNFNKQVNPVIQLIPNSLSVSSMLLAEEYSENGTITYDSNGNILSYPIKWKDGTSGIYTNTSWDANNNMYRGYEITYGESYKLVQPQVTVVDGKITNIPLKYIVELN